MPLTTLEFSPGIVTDNTDSVSENAYADGSNVRFRVGRAEVIGGWELVLSDTFTNPARGAASWATLNGDPVLGFGTATKLYDLLNGALTDITPLKVFTTLTNPFDTTNASATVKVTHVNHGLLAGDSVTFSHADAVGGLTINGAYTVVNVTSGDDYTITAASSATSTANGGGAVDVSAALDAGLVSSVLGGGYGSGGYGDGAYGSTTATASKLRIWSVSNWGEHMVASPSNGGLYEWQPAGSYPELVVNGDFSAAASWTTGTGWSIGSGVATASAGTASNLTQDVSTTLEPGKRYKLSVVITRSAGTLQFQVESGDVATGTVDTGEAINKSGTYTRYFYAPSNPVNIHFRKDASFDGTVDDVSITLIDVAYRIENAPYRSAGMFVDPNRIVVLYGTIEFDGDYGPMHVRWCDQENIRDWDPSVIDLAGDYTLGSGSYIVGALPSRGQNLIWTDSSLYTMRFTGSSADVFQFQLAGTGCGLIAKMAAAEHNGVAFWWGMDSQFYTFGGGQPEFIECPIRSEIVNNLDPLYVDKIAAGIVSEFTEVWWFYPDTRENTGENSRWVSFNWSTGVWSKGVLDRTTWVKTGVNTAPYGFGTDFKIYQHETGDTDNGAVIDWFLESGKLDLEDGDHLFNIYRYMPDFDDQVGGMKVTFSSYGWPRASSHKSSEHSIARNTTDVPLRHKGRQVQIKWEDNETCRFARFGNQRVDIKPSGARR